MVVSALAAALLAGAAPAGPAGLDPALARLADEGRFSGAVVVRNSDKEVFAKGYGLADPFTGRAFTPATQVDSGSLAKPVTAAAVLLLAREGRLDLDAPARRYLPGYPHGTATVRHLLAHSAGLDGDESAQALAWKTNAQLLDGVAGSSPLFAPGTGFSYCNYCYVALALLVERVANMSWLDFARSRLGLPDGVTVRPARLADWKDRAIGYRLKSGRPERFDSWEGERFYGSANLSLSASQLARWGAEWWSPRLAAVRRLASTRARVAGRLSGLTWGNWYCAPGGRRCHYLGHHEGFHHMVYRDTGRRVAIAMVSNNALDPALQQRLQRALVAFAEGRPADGRSELASPLAGMAVKAGRYTLANGEAIALAGGDGDGRMTVTRAGIAYPAIPVGSEIRYVPGLDAYVSGASAGRLRWLTLYEDWIGVPRPAG